MRDTAIRVENLGKLYQIGQRLTRYETLRDRIALFARSPFRNLRRLGTRGQKRELGYIWAIKDVSFEVKRGEVVGIIGGNGAGKSTLLRILSRITEPTEGYAEIRGRVGSLLEVGTGFHPELTGRENIYLNGAILGMKKAEIDRRFDEIVAFAEIEKFLDTPVKHYSSGMYMRLAFAVAAHLEPEILLVDEVLAVGDAAFQKKCLGKMGDVAKEGRTVLFVSHNMGAIASLCDRSLFLREGFLIKEGPAEEVISAYLGGGKRNEIRFPDGPVIKASVRQSEQGIELTVDYKVDRPIALPCLGFVIYDYLGNPVCGSNPLIDAVKETINPKPSGTVKVLIKYPRLLNGTYKISVWFGDGREDFFCAKDCLSIEIVDVTRPKPVPATSVGPVIPKCQWYFS
jgi:lipopolysaccharide transport system ATP-binding protein